jgi:subtilisin-like proprotein convertase family protein
MRVVNVETGVPGNITPCGAYQWGETEDYFVTIRDCVPVSVTTQPANTTTTCSNTTSLSVVLAGDNPSVQWERRLTPTSPWTFVTNNATFSAATTTTAGITTSVLTITGATDNLNGNQFRAVYSGSCTATDFSGNATLTVNPLVADVTPNPAVVCAGGSQALVINNIASGSVTTTVSSGPLTTVIPDDTPAGIVTAPINIAGIPAGAVISNISVAFNMTHTWVGDIDLNLIAPNGQNLNLVGALNNGTGGNGTDDFTNTVISSTSTTPISGAAAPRTGTFAAEKRDGYGPTGNEQTAATTNWPNLLAVVNGDWKLAIADFAAGDEGTLTSWSITITYVIPVGATGTWSPVTGLFTNAGLTTPYTGTPANTVYVAAPATTTDYTVIVQTPLCTTAPLVIPVIPATPIGGITQPANANGCAAGTVSFTADATSGGPLEYQWEVSSDGGATYTPVTDGGGYSGANTNTLEISNPAATLSGNLYHLVMSVPACGSTQTTNAATLTVFNNSTVSIAASPFTSLYPGLQTTLTATLNPAGTATSYQWFLNGDAIQGANSSTYVVDIDGLGEYSVDVNDANTCPASSNHILITDSLNTNLFIYPNPNTGVFQVRYNDKNNGVTKTRNVTIYDSKGSRVYNKAFANVTGFNRMDINLSGQPRGVYFVEVTDVAGKRLQTGRVVIF